jgi:hypothetical protein
MDIANARAVYGRCGAKVNADGSRSNRAQKYNKVCASVVLKKTRSQLIVNRVLGSCAVPKAKHRKRPFPKDFSEEPM